MFGIGETELVIIVVFAFLLFGPDKLPGMGRTLGRMLRQFREASDGLTEVVQTSIMDPAAEELERSDKSPKQRRREAELEAQAQALDASAEGAEAEGGETAEAAPEPTRRETFAERKARLMAERQAKERAEAEAAAAQAAQTDQAEADAAEPVAAEAETEATTSTSAAPEVAGPAAPAQEEPAPTTRTAADLYAMGGQRSSRFRAAETEVTETVAATDIAEEGEAPAGAPEDESDAKEEGGER